jgi:hypothetical protein
MLRRGAALLRPFLLRGQFVEAFDFRFKITNQKIRHYKANGKRKSRGGQRRWMAGAGFLFILSPGQSNRLETKHLRR